MISPTLSRRRFIYLSAAGVLAGGGYGLTRVVKRVGDAGARLTSQ
jgi:hypothetical protein